MLHHQSADLTLRQSILYRKPLDFARIYLRYPASIFNDLLDWLLLSHITLPVRNGWSVAQLPCRSIELSAAMPCCSISAFAWSVECPYFSPRYRTSRPDPWLLVGGSALALVISHSYLRHVGRVLSLLGRITPEQTVKFRSSLPSEPWLVRR